MKSRMMIGLLVIAIAAAVIGGGTMAWWSSQDDAGGPAQFHAGVLKIDVSDGLNAEVGVPLEFENMNPGDIFDPIVIEIKNTGTKNLAWFGNWKSLLKDVDLNDNLLDGVYIEMAKMEFLDTDGNPENWESTDQFVTDGIGSGDYPDWYNGLAATGPFPVISLRDWLDNSGMTSAPYEHLGALKPGFAYRLTVQFGFYEDVDNDFQGNKASPIEVSFQVYATQLHEDALADVPLADQTNKLSWLELQIAKQ